MLGHVTTITQKNNFVLSNIDPGAGGTSTKKVKIGNFPNIFDDDCRCPRQIQSVFNLIVDILMDIHVIVNRQLSKRVSTEQSHLTVSRIQVYNSLR